MPLLHQLMDAGGFKAAGEVHLFKPKDAYRLPGGGGLIFRPPLQLERIRPAGGGLITTKAKPATDLVLEILDGNGKSIRKFTARVPRPQSGGTPAPGEQPAAPPPDEGEGFGGGGPARLTTDIGLNRFIWDLRYSEAVRFPGMILWAGETRGPKIVPGTYQVKLTVDGKTMQENFTVKADPRLRTSPAEYAKQLEFALKIRDKLSETNNAIIQIRDVRKQVDDLLKRIKDQPAAKNINDAGANLNKSLIAIEEALYQTKNQSSQDPLNFPIRLNNKLAALGGVVAGAESAPTDQSYAVYAALAGQIDAELQKLSQIVKTDVPAFNQLVRDQNIPAVVLKPPPQP